MRGSHPSAAARGAGGSKWSRWNFNHGAALAIAVLAAALLVAVPFQVAKPQKLFGRALSALDPTLYPRFVLGALLVIAIAYFVVSGRLRELNLFRAIDAQGYFNVGVSLVCVVAYAFVLPILGFVVSGIALTFVLTVFYGNRNHYLTVAVSVLAPLAIYYGATRLLLVSLPEFPFY
jgi:putative tricarboxylic transport membrane protein